MRVRLLEWLEGRSPVVLRYRGTEMPNEGPPKRFCPKVDMRGGLAMSSGRHSTHETREGLDSYQHCGPFCLMTL